MEATAAHNTDAISQKHDSVDEPNGKYPATARGQPDSHAAYENSVLDGRKNTYGPTTITENKFDITINLVPAAGRENDISPAAPEVVVKTIEAVVRGSQATESE